VTRTRRLPLYWRVVLTNGVVFAAGTVALVVSPATVSARLLESEAVVLGIGLSVMLVTNALLLRSELAPLDRLASTMATVRSPAPGERLPREGTGVAADLIRSYNAMLDRLERERATSNARALAAQEEERRRISHELHDEIGQSLTVILLGLKRVADSSDPRTAHELEPVQESVRSCLDEVRQVARRLRPGVLDLGLTTALSSLASEVGRHAGVDVRRHIAAGLPALDPAVDVVVYRVVQEALTNVSRHSGASTVTLFVDLQGPDLLVRVVDDGQGIQGEADGSGIQGMRERAALAGGRVDVRPAAGGGTEVRLLVPVAGS
jgi:two-component system sensor histidine kinase UhpB